jgi:hypothetical protein
MIGVVAAPHRRRMQCKCLVCTIASACESTGASKLGRVDRRAENLVACYFDHKQSLVRARPHTFGTALCRGACASLAATPIGHCDLECFVPMPASNQRSFPLFVQQRFPVCRHRSGRSRCRLIRRMRVRSVKPRAGDKFFSAIVIKPPLARFEARDYRMTRSGVMFRSMLTWRTITAADVTTFGASSKMQPPPTLSQAFDATRSAWLGRRVDTISLGLHGLLSGFRLLELASRCRSVGDRHRCFHASCRLAISEVRLALPNFYNVAVRIANVAARLAVLVLRLCDKLGSPASP